MKSKEHILRYLDQLSLRMTNNIREMNLALEYISELSSLLAKEEKTPTPPIIYDPLATDKLAEKPPECLIRIKEVCLMVGVSKTTIYRMVNTGEFPAPLDLGPRFKAWQKKTVIDWINSFSNYQDR